jgi:hypothetical protein
MDHSNSKRLFLLLMIAAFSYFLIQMIDDPGRVAAKDLKKYLGEKNCASCHKKEYEIWLKSAHAKAYEKLSMEKREDITCLWCHSTDARDNFKALTLKSVSCEACHGLGTLYTTGSMTDNFAEYHKSRLKKQDESVCLGCHTKARTPAVTDFDYQASLEKIKHWENKKP